MTDRIFRRASHADYEAIRTFLHDHWDENFSVVQSRTLFDFLYKDAQKLHFVLAVDDGAIVALLGVSPYGDKNSDAFLTLWRSIESSGNAGLELLKFARTLGYRSLNSVGTRKEVLIIYKMLGYKSGAMDHHVRVSRSRDDFSILALGDFTNPTVIKTPTRAKMTEVDTFDPTFAYFEKQSEVSPYKSLAYLSHRYLAHPIYQYRVWELRAEGKVVNYFVTRTVTVGKATALRLVDCVADATGFEFFATLMDDVIDREGHEYIDFYSLNFDSEKLITAGYVRPDTIAGMIVPNFFEPFLQESEQKYYVTTLQNPCLYKGDGDMDRPYRLQFEAAS